MPTIGDVIGDYRIVELIGKGGMGQVFRGQEALLERDVAIKALHPELTQDSEVLERFQLEAKTLSKLQHPHIAMLYRFFQQDGRYYMVMEYVQGQTLAEVMRHYPHGMPWRLAVLLIGQVLSALDYAHGKGVIHRDIKPANLVVQEDNRTLKVMDFGVARILGSNKLTRTGFMAGTLKYMSPEQVQCVPSLDGRSDQYSTGLVLYEMLCGHAPFNESSEYDLIRAQVEAPPPPLFDRLPDLPPKLESLVMRALSKNPQDRFGSAWEFQQLLESVAREDSLWDESTRLAYNPADLGASPIRSGVQARPADFHVSEPHRSAPRAIPLTARSATAGSAQARHAWDASQAPHKPAWALSKPWVIGLGMGGVVGIALAFLLNAIKEQPPAQSPPVQSQQSQSTMRQEDAGAVARQETLRLKDEIVTLKKAVEASRLQIHEQALEAGRKAKHFAELLAAAPSEDKRLDFQASAFEAEYQFDQLVEVETQFLQQIQGEQGVRSLDAAFNAAVAALDSGNANEASQGLALNLAAWQKLKEFPLQARQRQSEKENDLFNLLNGRWAVDSCKSASIWQVGNRHVTVAWPNQKPGEERILAIRDNFIYAVKETATSRHDIFRYRPDGQFMKAEDVAKGQGVTLKKCLP